MFGVAICLLHVLFSSMFLTSEGRNADQRSKAAGMSIEKRLIKELLLRYNESGQIGRPVEDSKDVIQVRFSLALIQILDLDENLQALRTICWLRFKWNDILLKWSALNDTKFNQIQEIRIFPYQIWTPDIKLYNFADERLLEQREARVVVYANGEVLWVPQALFISRCPVEIMYFPYDSQMCVLDFGSWTYDTSQLDLTWWSEDNINDIPYVDFSDYVPSNEWHTDGQDEIGLPNVQPHERINQIRSLKHFRESNYTTGDGHQETRHYAVLRYRLRLSRNPKFYAALLVIPCILLSCLTLVLFWLPPESPAKMMLGMNIFVAFFVLLLLLAESTPSAVKNFPLIGSYYCLNMIMITLSTFLAVIVINLYFRGDRKGHVPPKIRRIFIEGMGRLLLVRQNIPLPDERKLVHAIVGETSCRPGGNRDRTRKVHLPELKYNKFQMNETSTDGNVSHQRSSSSDNGYTGLVEPQDSPILSNYSSVMEKDVREIKRYIRMFVSRQKDRERKNLLAMEWRTMAVVLDRMFFVLYLVAICVAFITMIPRRMPPPEDPEKDAVLRAQAAAAAAAAAKHAASDQLSTVTPLAAALR